MKRMSIGAALLVFGMTACSQDEDRFFVLHNQAASEGCLISADRDRPYVGQGTLDLALVGPRTPYGYLLHPLLQNDLEKLSEPGVAEPNRLALRGFEVRVSLGAGAPAKIQQLFAELQSSDEGRALLGYDVPWSGAVEPGGGLAASSVNAIPGELARRIRATEELSKVSHVTLFTKVRAKADGAGRSVESKEFVFPVELCLGCLVGNVAPCPAAPVNKGNACNVAQDATVDCCTNGADLVCPSIAPTSEGK
jgi:hypothetical protein